MSRSVRVGLVVLLLCLGAVGCGEEGNDGEGAQEQTTQPATAPETETQTAPETQAGGEQVFTATGCDSCHTLAAAGADASIGPNLAASSSTTASWTPSPQCFHSASR